MTSIDLSIVRNFGVNIVSSSQILMLNICFFIQYFVLSIFLTQRRSGASQHMTKTTIILICVYILF